MHGGNGYQKPGDLWEIGVAMTERWRLVEGRELFEASPSSDKKFLKIEGANHNDLFFRGMTEYLDAIKQLTDNLKAG